jgi:hypothetical protein
VADLDRLHRIVGEEIGGHEAEWARNFADALLRVQLSFWRHRGDERAPEEGVLSEVDSTVPTLARHADEVRDEHDRLLAQVISLREDAQRTLFYCANLESLRERGQRMWSELEKNRLAELDLVLDSMNTDIGVGD